MTNESHVCTTEVTEVTEETQSEAESLTGDHATPGQKPNEATVRSVITNSQTAGPLVLLFFVVSIPGPLAQAM